MLNQTQIDKISDVQSEKDASPYHRKIWKNPLKSYSPATRKRMPF